MRHLRRAPVAVLVGDGLDAAAPRHRDVAVEEAEVDAHHRHPAYAPGCGDRVPLRAAAAGTATPARSRGEDPTLRQQINLGQGVGTAEVEPPACAAPRRAASAPARRLVATAVRRPQPAVTALCACALGPGRREPPVGWGSAASPSAAPVSARQRLAAQQRVRERAGKGRRRGRGAGRGGEGRGGAAAARREARPSGLRATAGRAAAAGGAPLPQRGRPPRLGVALLSTARLARPLARILRRPRQPRPGRSPAGLVAPRGPCAASAEAPPGSRSVRWRPLCGARAAPASEPPRCARPRPRTWSAFAMKSGFPGPDLRPGELRKRSLRGAVLPVCTLNRCYTHEDWRPSSCPCTSQGELGSLPSGPCVLGSLGAGSSWTR